MKIGEHHEIKVVIIENDLGIGIGNGFFSYDEFVMKNPYSSYTFGYAVVDTRDGMIPGNCNNWNSSPEEALFDYSDNVESRLIEV
jgi:hypothetical protein